MLKAELGWLQFSLLIHEFHGFLALWSGGVYGELVKFLAPSVQTMGFPVFKQKTDPARPGSVSTGFRRFRVKISKSSKYRFG